MVGMTGIAAIVFAIYKKVMHKQKVISNLDTIITQADDKDMSQGDDDKNMLIDEKDDTNIKRTAKIFNCFIKIIFKRVPICTSLAVRSLRITSSFCKF